MQILYLFIRIKNNCNTSIFDYFQFVLCLVYYRLQLVTRFTTKSINLWPLLTYWLQNITCCVSPSAKILYFLYLNIINGKLFRSRNHIFCDIILRCGDPSIFLNAVYLYNKNYIYGAYLESKYRFGTYAASAFQSCMLVFLGHRLSTDANLVALGCVFRLLCTFHVFETIPYSVIK